MSLTDPDASMATSSGGRRLEPSYKQHTAVDDACGVVLDVAVTTGEVNEGDMIEVQVDEVRQGLGREVATVTADAGYCFAKVYDGLERRNINPLIPAKKEAFWSRVPLRRFRYDARHGIVKCPRGKILHPAYPSKDGHFYRAKLSDCARCPLRAECLPKTRGNKTVAIPHGYPALLRARRRRGQWNEEELRLYQRHRWRSEGFHGEAKTWHGLDRALRRGLENMKIQAYLTAAAINLKRLAAAVVFIAVQSAIWIALKTLQDLLRARHANVVRNLSLATPHA